MAPAWAACSGSSPNWTAANTTPTEVAACITAAASGTSAQEVITIPAGSSTWTSGVTLPSTKTIHLTAVTPGTVTITGNFPGTTNLIRIDESTTGHHQVSNLNFVQPSGSEAYVIRWFSTASGKAVILGPTNVVTFSATSGNAFRGGSNRGLIYNNTFTGGNNLSVQTNSAIRLYVGADDTLWNAEPTIGTLDTTGESNVYAEGNTFTNLYTETLDPADNARMVIRYNTFTDAGSASHGQDTSLISGMRHIEIYNNTFSYTNGAANCSATGTRNLDYWFLVRGGTWYVTDNDIEKICSQDWGNKSTYKQTIENLRRSAGTYACWAGGYPAPKQVGFGWTGGAQVSAPNRFWNNTGTGATILSNFDYTPDECGGGPAVSGFIQLDRDYFFSAPSSYTKYTYPHPLTGEVAAIPATAISGKVTIGGSVTIR